MNTLWENIFTFSPTKALHWKKNTVFQMKTFLKIKTWNQKTQSNKELDLLVLKIEKKIKRIWKKKLSTVSDGAIQIGGEKN